MKMLFVHDNRFLKYKDLYYSVFFTNHLLKDRYLKFFDEMTIVGRGQNVNDEIEVNELSLSSCDHVFFDLVECNNLVFGSLFQRKKIIPIIRDAISRCDCAVVRLPCILGVLAVNLLRKAGKPYLVELVGCAWDSYRNHSLSGKIIAPFMWYLTRRSVYHAPQVVYITDRFLQKRYPSAGHAYICVNAMIDNISEDVLNKRLDKLRQKNDPGRIVLGSVGALLKYKGHAYVIEAMPSLIEMGYDVYYEIIGEGDQTQLREYAKKCNLSDRVILHGNVKHEAVFEWLDGIDIYVQPSDAEAQGRALIEAMSRGCPCVCTAVGGMVELIEPQYVAQKSNPVDIGKKIDLLLRSDLIEVAKRNFNYVKRFDFTSVENERMLVFQSAFGGLLDKANI